MASYPDFVGMTQGQIATEHNPVPHPVKKTGVEYFTEKETQCPRYSGKKQYNQLILDKGEESLFTNNQSGVFMRRGFFIIYQFFLQAGREIFLHVLYHK